MANISIFIEPLLGRGLADENQRPLKLTTIYAENRRVPEH